MFANPICVQNLERIGKRQTWILCLKKMFSHRLEQMKTDSKLIIEFAEYSL